MVSAKQCLFAVFGVVAVVVLYLSDVSPARLVRYGQQLDARRLGEHDHHTTMRPPCPKQEKDKKQKLLDPADPEFAHWAHFCDGVFPSHADDFDNEISRMAQLLEMKPGMKYCEVAAAGGMFAFRLGREALPGGRIQLTVGTVEEVRAIKGVAIKQGLASVTQVRRGTNAVSGLPQTGQCDVLQCRMSWHFITNPVMYVRELYAAMKPGGLALISDHRPNATEILSDYSPEKRGGGVMLPPSVELEDFTGGGFELVQFVDWPYFHNGYAHLFKRPS